MKSFFRNKKILITGHTGFKGSWLTQILLRLGADVVGVSLPSHTDPSLFEVLEIKKKIKNYFEDVKNFEKIKEIFYKEKPEIVFHLAAQALVRESYNNPLNTYETNILGTVNILQNIKGIGSVSSAVIITSDKVYENKEKTTPYKEGDPLGGFDPYSASKAAADIVAKSYINSFFNPKKYDHDHKTLIAIARSGNVIGGGDWNRDRLIPDIIRAVCTGDKKIIIRNPKAIRPWQHVIEPLSGYLLLAEKLYNGDANAVGTWNFGPNADSHISVKEVVEKAISFFGGNYLVLPDNKKYEAKILKLDISKAKKELQWKPRFSIKDCLEHTFNWYKTFYENKNEIKNITNKQIEIFFNI